MALQCLLIDDSVEVLESLCRLLESEGLVVVAQSTTGIAGIQHAHDLEPDVILLDVDLGEESGLDVAHVLASAGVQAAVILVSAHPEYACIATELPALGFLNKGEVSRAAIEEMLERGPGPRQSAGI